MSDHPPDKQKGTETTTSDESEPNTDQEALQKKRFTHEDLAKSIISLYQQPGVINIEKTLLKRGYTLRKVVGEGAYAKVYITDYVDPANEKKSVTLACKVIDGLKAPKDFIKKFFPRELSLLCKINHHCLVRIHSMLKLSTKYFLFMYYCANGDMLGFMKKNGAIKEVRARIWFSQILEGMEYLHTKNIVHRDLKCENILLTEDFRIKIADFGFARYFQEEVDEKSHTFCGSVTYAPPEIIRGKSYNPKLADIWSLGIILFIMLNLSMPFENTGKLIQLYESQMNRQWKVRSKLENILSQEVKTLIYNILEPIPENRPSLEQLRQDPWFRKEPFKDDILPKSQNTNSPNSSASKKSEPVKSHHSLPSNPSK